MAAVAGLGRENEGDIVRGRIDDWRRRLIDLSHRNRLIAYKATKATTLTIVAPSLDELVDPGRTRPWDFFFPPEPEEGVESGESDAVTTVDEAVLATHGATASRGMHEIEVTEPNPRRIQRILDNLAKRSNAEFQDKALRILYVAAGFLDWYDQSRERHITSPLVLIPVELRRESPRDPYRLYFLEDEDIVINPSLTEKLSRDAGLAMPEDWAWEDKPLGVELDEIRAAISETDWVVREEAAIGLFSFQKHVMYRDLVDNEDRVARHELISSLARGTLSDELRDAGLAVPELGELDDVQDPAETLSILDADGSQRQCIEAAGIGTSFVMHGPPGTGKSQTIANLIAESIGQGKRVLFVSEKAAALDVVYNRLAASGLHEYCLKLHGEHAGRREVVQALDESLTSQLVARTGMRADEFERLANLRTLLNDSAELLHSPWPELGSRSLREVHAELAALHDAPQVPGAPEASEARERAVLDEYQRLEEVFQRLSERWRVSPRDFIWRDFDGERFTGDDHARVMSNLRQAIDLSGAVAKLASRTAEQLGSPVPQTLEDASRLAELGDHLMTAPPLEADWLEGAAPNRLRATVNEARSAYDRRSERRASFGRQFPERGLADLPATLPDELKAARAAVKQVAGWTSLWDTDLGALGRRLEALDQLPAQIDALAQRAASTAQLLGQPTDSPTLGRVAQLADLADLAFRADYRPEREWLAAAGRERSREVVAQVSDSLSRYGEQIGRIQAAGYAPEALALPAGELRGRLAAQQGSSLAVLSGSYRRDVKAVKECRSDGKLPPTVVDDLALIENTQALGAWLDAQDERMRRAFGTYHAGRLTALAPIHAGLATADRVAELSSADADLAQLGSRVCAGSPADPALAQAADTLRAASTALENGFAELGSLVDRATWPSADTLDNVARVASAAATPIRTMAQLINNLNSGAAAPAKTFADVERRAELVAALHADTAAIDTREPEWRAVLGVAFAHEATDWPQIDAAADWTERLVTLLGGDPPAVLRAALAAGERSWPAIEELRDRSDQLSGLIADLAAEFAEPRRAALADYLRRSPLDRVGGFVAQMQECSEDLYDWAEWQAWRGRAAREGWESFVDGLIDHEISREDVLPAFRRAFWNRRLDALFEAERELSEDLRGGAFQRWVDEFRVLDQKLVATGADRLIAIRESNRGAHVAGTGSEVDLLRREARKKRRHLPVRVLLSRIPTLLSDLKPCLMMSPLTVSHFLSPEHTFDLVLFDEASQVPPQDAVNCIYRGRQLVVAGDSKQLPPTPFFQVAELEEIGLDDEEGLEEDMESILDSCEALLPSHALRWHYRSRAESLIAFSNQHVYRGELVTFPSPEERSPRLGVSCTYVAEGQYDRGKSATNRREAQVVAQRVLHHLRESPERSLGVIAFNSAQANAIAEELDVVRLMNPELEDHFRGDRLDAVFVKHLEAVQGDERDVILLSVGYGRDQHGKFTMNFGPLNKDGGHRRLNVAITRAREALEIVASVRSQDFSLADGASHGSQLLRDYIAYAEAGGWVETPEEIANGEWATPLEQSIAETVRELGFTPVPEVGAGKFRIDIGVLDPADHDRFLLGIECDGEAYVRTPTARDRDRLRPQVLSDLRWNVHRIWSLDWVRSRTAERERLAQALRAASDGRDEPPLHDLPPADGSNEAARERVRREVHELGGSADAEQLPWTRIYEVAQLPPQSSMYEFDHSANRSRQADLLAKLLEAEAPVSQDYAIRRLAECWGHRRVGHKILAAGRRAIAKVVAQRRTAVIRGDFIWLPDQTLTYVRIPDPFSPETRREIEDIPLEEIDLAVSRLLESSPGADPAQLTSQVARVLGFDRTGGRIRPVIEGRVSALAARSARVSD